MENNLMMVQTKRGTITANESLLNDIMLACFERSKYFEQFGRLTQTQADEFRDIAVSILDAINSDK